MLFIHGRCDVERIREVGMLQSKSWKPIHLQVREGKSAPAGPGTRRHLSRPPSSPEDLARTQWLITTTLALPKLAFYPSFCLRAAQ